MGNPRLVDSRLSRVHIKSDYGGLGDQISRLPAFKYIIEQYSTLFFAIYVHDFALEVMERALKHAIPKSQNYALMPMSIWEKRITKGTFELDFLGHNINSMRMPLTQFAHLILDNAPHTGVEENRYLSIPVKPGVRATKEKYVVVTTGFTAPTRELKVEVINEIILYLRSKNVTPVLLGAAEAKTGDINNIGAKFSSEILVSQCVDLRGNTDLLTCYYYLGNSLAVLGLDNGLLHLASMSEVPVLWGFTTVRPAHRVPYRQVGINYILEPRSHCRYCQSDNHYVAQDFRLCFYDTYDCTKSLTASHYTSILKEILTK